MFTVIIPTLQKNIKILNLLVQSCVENSLVKEIIIIDNSKRGYLNDSKKVKVINPSKNLYVNPAWNYGVKLSTTPYFALLNDDILIPDNIFSQVYEFLRDNPNTGVIGMDTESVYNTNSNNCPLNTTINFEQVHGICANWGCAIWGIKNNYKKIPEKMKVWCGDNFLIFANDKTNNPSYKIKDTKIIHLGGCTSKSQRFDKIKRNDVKTFIKINPQFKNQISDKLKKELKIDTMPIIQRIFSVKNEYNNNFKHKIISILGIKIKFRIKTPLEKQLKPLKYKKHKKSPKVYLAIAAILKNEAPYIVEWIEYHKLVGIERFYLYDNESDDNVKEILKPYIDDGTVIYQYVEGKCMQIPVYNDAIYRYKNDTEWMAIIDLDEYLVPIEKNDLKDFLKDYEAFSAIGVNSIMYDSCGYIEKPDLLTTEAYIRRRKDLRSDNCVVKSIVKPKDVLYNNNPHFCYMKPNKTIVSSDYAIMQDCITQKPNVDKIRLNHYHTRSLAEYKAKTAKGFADQLNIRTFKQERYIFETDTVVDDCIYKYLPELKKRLHDINFL